MILRRKRDIRLKLALGIVAALVLVAGSWWLLAGNNFEVLNPKGVIAAHERNLMVIAILLMLIVVLPVFALTFFIVWKYRVGNGRRAPYQPDWDHNRKAETAWWLIPFTIIAVLSVITWKSSHDLDPFKPISSDKKAITIQVVAMQWKWLFIYPEQGIATVNEVHFPVDTPVNFHITSDAPMNSFWIPQLGGQIYAMAGMSTQLHLMASQTGNYNGSSANISGSGFAGMRFVATVTPHAEFDSWVSHVRSSSPVLGGDEYRTLANPSVNNAHKAYAVDDTGLYTMVIMKYMAPGGVQDSSMGEGSHDH